MSYKYFSLPVFFGDYKGFRQIKGNVFCFLFLFCLKKKVPCPLLDGCVIKVEYAYYIFRSYDRILT